MKLEIVNSGNNYFTFERSEGVLTPVLREEIEKWRGIERLDGQISRSYEWKKERVEKLSEKINDYFLRLDFATEELWNLQEELGIEKTKFTNPYLKVEKEVQYVETVIYKTFWDSIKEWFKGFFHG